jgi:tetratricopeptide (TPR) repeat protein
VRWWTIAAALAALGTAGLRGAADSAAAERAVLDADIAFFARRAAADPRGAADRLQLAALYARRAHASGAPADWVRAESLARRSLALRAAHNTRALAVLAGALVAQHRFAEAEAAAAALERAEPWVPGHRALRGEVLLELGRYDAARAVFDSLRIVATEAAVAPRYARWLELTGDVAASRRLLEAALAEARRARHMTRDQRAWYWWRLADFELRQGRRRAARRALDGGLAVAPDDGRLLLTEAGLLVAEGRWRAAVRAGEAALARATDLTPLVVLADAYRGAGDTARAADALRALEAAVAASPEPLHRQWALALLDHERSADLIYRQACAELASRRDVYGYDVAAWAALASGRPAEARSLMDSALALGTRDPLLRRHAAAIDAALER